MTITWDSTLRARSVNAELRNLARSGGRTLAGTEPRVFNDGGLWEVAVGAVPLRRHAQVIAWQAMMGRLRCGEDLIVPICDPYRPLGALQGATVTLSLAALAGATTLALSARGLDIRAGHRFGLGNDRLYQISRITSGPSPGVPFVSQLANDLPWDDRVPLVDNVATPSAYIVEVLPPLRADAASGAVADFAAPKLRCVLKDLADGDQNRDLRRAAPSFTLIEKLGD